jgi:hypothetical protein
MDTNVDQDNYLIWQIASFELRAEANPLIDRDDGGHIAIYPKKRILNRQALTRKEAIEFMWFTMIAGEAMEVGMNINGVDIGRINYQDNGNWAVFTDAGPYFHLHLYGRAKSAKIQKYGQSLFFPHRDDNPTFYTSSKPISKTDIVEIRKQIFVLSQSARYSMEEWNL